MHTAVDDLEQGMGIENIPTDQPSIQPMGVFAVYQTNDTFNLYGPEQRSYVKAPRTVEQNIKMEKTHELQETAQSSF